MRSASIWVTTPEVVLGHVDGDVLDRLVDLALHLAGDDLGLADGELEPLAAHHLHEHRELQLAPSLHLPRVGPVGVEDPQGDVADQFGVEPRLHLAGGELGAVLARERRRVDADRHREAGVVDVGHRERARIVGIGERLTDGHVGEAGDGHDLARSHLFGVDAVERFGHVELGDAHGLDGAIGAAPRHRLPLAQRAVPHPAERDAADVRRRVEVRDQRLERVGLVVLGCRDVIEQHLEQRLQPVGAPGLAGDEVGIVGVERGATVARVAVDDREVDLVLVGVEVEEELLHLVDHLGHARVAAVDLVHHEDDGQARFERLAQHEARSAEAVPRWRRRAAARRRPW